MDPVKVVTTLLQHNYQLLTVPELVRVSACCKEWRQVVIMELKQPFAACKVMYNFLTAVPRCPRVTLPRNYEYGEHEFAESDWAPFLAALNDEMTPLQLALYYTYCFWVGTHHLSPSLLGHVSITLSLHPSGTVKQIKSQRGAEKAKAPCIQFEKTWTSWTVMLNFSDSSIDADKVDVWLIGAGTDIEPRVFELLEAAQFTEHDLSRMAYVMIPWQHAQLEPAVTYETTDKPDTVREKQEVSVCFPLAVGNVIFKR